MVTNRLCWRVGGQAGDGIMTVGQGFAKACTRGGLQVSAYTEFPSLIRGGHNNYWVRVEDREVYTPLLRTDLLVAINRETVDIHKETLSENSAIIYDPKDVEIGKNELKDVLLVPIPLNKIAIDIGNKIYKNIVAVGASVGMVDYEFSYLQSVITDNFKKKGKDVINANLKAAKEGYDQTEGLRNEFPHSLKPVKGAPKRMLVSGNQSISMGAIKGGCKFYSTYPMTPSSDLLDYFAKQEEKYNIVVKQTEDEIAGLCFAIGAAHVGVRAMAGTSGGGFSLMNEPLSLAGITETPVVVAVVSRPGPSTGMPTWTAQGDLRFVIHSGHGEFPRFLIAPGDLEEAFYTTFHIFNLVEKYQTPGIILSDKFLSMSYWSQELFDTSKLKIERGKLLSDAEVLKLAKEHGGRAPRYLNTKDGISPRWFPGQKGGQFVKTANEHTEFSNISEDPDNRIIQMDKRWRKMETAMKEIPGPKLYGPKKAPLTIVCWGSTKLPVLEAMRMLDEEGIKINLLHFVYILPFPVEKARKAFDRAEKTFLLEGNVDGQFAGFLKERADRQPDEIYLKYNGRPFYAEDIVKKVKAILKVKVTVKR